MNFILHNWLFHSAFQEGLSIFFVCVLRLDEPHEWPPMFGNILEAYTVRRFWAHFWHRLVYAPYRAAADKLSALVFRPEDRSTTRRFANVALVFLISGMFHSILDWKNGMCSYWGSGVFYSVQPFGIVLESLVQLAWAPLPGRVFSSRLWSILERALGYAWVFLWFYWIYPQRSIWENNCSRSKT